MLAICSSVAFIVGVGSAHVQAGHMGAGPGKMLIEFFPNNPLVMWEEELVISYGGNIEGYQLFFVGPEDDPGPPPEGVYGSFVRGSEQHYVQFVDPGAKDQRLGEPLFLGYAGPDAPLPTAPDAYQAGKIRVNGVVESGNVGVAVALTLGLRYRPPQIPATSWTLTNTAAHDITDGRILLERGPGLRYLVLPDIPAGASITVEGQMAPEWAWTFGGMLDAPTPEPVIAFGPGGESPEGRNFTDVFTDNSDYPFCGLGAAVLATKGHWNTADLGCIGYDRPEAEYQCAFDAESFVPVDFDLYAFSTGQKVGSGTQAEILEDRTWDPGHNPANPTGGTGTWNATAADWSDGAADVTWDSSIEPDAVFAGAPGTVTLVEAAAARSLTFTSDGYTVTGTEPLTVGYWGVRVTAGNEATIEAPIAGDSGLTKRGEGKLTLTGANTFTGDTVIHNGTVAITSGAALGDPANGVTLAKNTTLELLSGLTTNRSFTTAPGGGGTIHVRSGTFRPVATLAGPNVRVDPGCTFDAGNAPLHPGRVTLDHATFTSDGNGPDGGPADEPITFNKLEMTGGTVIVGTGDKGTRLEGGHIQTYADEATSLVTSLSTANPENQWLSLEVADIADGSAAVDCDMQVCLCSSRLATAGPGVLRLSGACPNDVTYLYLAHGTVELAKPAGVTAINGDILMTYGTLRLLNSHQISDHADIILPSVAWGHIHTYLETNGHDETLGQLVLQTYGAIDLGSDSTSILRFADSHSSDWDLAATLFILQWSGDLAGGGTEGLFFGTDATGLTGDQLTRIRFLDPLGLPPGNYDARILDTGEVMPLPEPATLALLAAGGLGLALRRRRR